MRIISYAAAMALICLNACGTNSAGQSQRPGMGGSSAMGGNAGSATTSGGGPGGGMGGANGGSAGSSGAPQSGGTAGSAGSTGGVGTGGSAGTGGAVNAVVVDDFEGTAVGGPPNPALFAVRGNGTIQISTEVPRPGGGAQVVKVVSGGSGATMFLNTGVFPLPAGVIHFRVFMRFTDANWMQHVGFVEASPGQESQEVRFGGQADAYHANLAADGDGLSPNPFEYPSCMMCVAPVANEWACLRGMFDFPNNRAQLYVNDALAVDANEQADWHSGTGMLPQNPTEIGFGWAMYGGVQNTVYYDNLAIGYDPIPCQ
jgi:Cip1-like, core domain